MYTRYADLRDSHGLTDYEVANKTGIPASTLYDWKQRFLVKVDARLSLDNASKLARFFGVNIDYFMEDADGQHKDD